MTSIIIAYPFIFVKFLRTKERIFFMKRRPDGRWQKRITLPNGKSKLLYSSEATERKAIQDFNMQMLNLTQEEESATLFEHVAERWKDDHFEKMQSNTLKQYKPCYSAAVDFFKGYKISEIKPKHISQYIACLTAKGYAQKTINNRVLIVSLIFNYAILNEYADSNPTRLVTIPKNLPKTKRTNASKEDEKKICASTDTLCGVLAYLYLTTGCRRGEATALQPRDINCAEKKLIINKTVEWIGNKPHIKDAPKTEAGIREIPISDKLISLLAPYMKQKYLFQNTNGELIDNSQFTRMWNDYKKQVGISCTPHELRHSYATLLFDAGVDVKTAQAWLGHADIKTTLSIYTHLSQMKVDTMSDKINEYLVANY